MLEFSMTGRSTSSQGISGQERLGNRFPTGISTGHSLMYARS